MNEGKERANIKRNPPSEKNAGLPPAPQPSGLNYMVTIPRALVFRLLGEMEQMASLIDSEWGDNREPSELIEAGVMPECYYQLRAFLLPSSPNDDLIDIERDNE